MRVLGFWNTPLSQNKDFLLRFTPSPLKKKQGCSGVTHPLLQQKSGHTAAKVLPFSKKRVDIICVITPFIEEQGHAFPYYHTSHLSQNCFKLLSPSPPL